MTTSRPDRRNEDRTGGKPETPLETAEQHVRDARERVRRQRQILSDMERDDHPRAAELARQTLIIFEENLRLAHEHLELERAHWGKE